MQHHQNQIENFGFSTSEDALTWTVFKFLHDTGQLATCLELSGLGNRPPNERPPSLLIWGAPVPLDQNANEHGWALRQRLISISEWLLENQGSRTEPDVVIDMGQFGIVIVEVKHTSPTRQRSRIMTGGTRIYPEGHPIRASLCYRACPQLAIRNRTRLVSAMPLYARLARTKTLFQEQDELIGGFEACLPPQGLARFRRLTWNSLLATITDPPEWLVRYVQARGYFLPGGHY